MITNKKTLMICAAAGFFAIVVAFGGARAWNKAKREGLCRTYARDRKTELAQGVLWGLLRDYPTSSTVLSLASDIDILIEEEKAAAAERWRRVEETCVRVESIERRLATLQGTVSRFQANVESFQELERVQWVEEITAREYVADTDYLYRLLTEKRIEKGRLTVREIEVAVVAAETLARSGANERARAESVRVLRSEPNNARAAAVYCYATASIAPESVDSIKVILPVANYLVQTIPSNYYALCATGKIYEADGNYAIAEERYRKAISSKPRDFSSIEADLGYIRAVVRQGRGSEVRSAAEAIWARDRTNEVYTLLLWDCLQGESRESKVDFLSRWGAAVPSSYLPDYYLGELANAAGDIDTAIRHYTSSAQKRPTKEVHKRLSDLLYSAGDRQGGAAYARKYLADINPNIASEQTVYLEYLRRAIVSDFEAGQYAVVAQDCARYNSIRSGDVEMIAMEGEANRAIKNAPRAIELFERVMDAGDYDRVAVSYLETFMMEKQYMEVQKKGKKLLSKVKDSSVERKIRELIDSAEVMAGKKQR